MKKRNYRNYSQHATDAIFLVNCVFLDQTPQIQAVHAWVWSLDSKTRLL